MHFALLRDRDIYFSEDFVLNILFSFKFISNGDVKKNISKILFEIKKNHYVQNYLIFIPENISSKYKIIRFCQSMLWSFSKMTLETIECTISE